MYDSTLIRTGNMAPDRSTDLYFHQPDEDGVLQPIEPSMTQQHFTDECDVNRIVKSSGFQPLDPAQLRFADVSEILSYEEALQIVMKAEDSFAALPAEIRARFQNNPQEMVSFLSDPANSEEAVKLGLATKPTTDSSTEAKAEENASQ